MFDEMFPPAEDELELGWRARPIMLAALGAAVLTRKAYDLRMVKRAPLEMQVLAYLGLLVEGERERAAWEPGEEVESLTSALACDQRELELALQRLSAAQLIAHPPDTEAERVAITAAGMHEVEMWLSRIVGLFAGWPPDNLEVDDLTR